VVKDLNDHTRARLEKALLYIDANLSDNMKVTDIARHASLSPFHFQRLFSAYLGEPVSRYVLLRRLERAARTLASDPEANILDLALDVGFETHSAFSKAFRQHYGQSPSMFRMGETEAPSGPDKGRPYLLANPGGVRTEVPEIIQLAAFELQYRQSSGTASGTFFQLHDKDIGQQFAALLVANPDPCLNTISCFPESPQGLNDTAVPIWFGGMFATCTDNNWSAHWQGFEGGKWAVFDHVGEYSFLYQTWNRIYRNWLPQSGFDLRDALPFEAYITAPGSRPPEQWLTKIHIPVN
jgi:AraC family transcriptional regulator